MPVRVIALPPGEFIRNHLVDVGGMDYPQSIHRAYKAHLLAQGVKHGASRASMSKYVWLANKMGLIVFDHADSAEYWGDVHDGVTVAPGYVRESRPQAPSPRHYYRIVDPTDGRWVRLEASYRESIGLEVPPAAPRVPLPLPVAVVVEEPLAAPPARPPKVPPKPKVPSKPKVPPAVLAAPYEVRAEEIRETLDRLLEAPSLKAVGDIESQLVDLGDEVVEAAGRASGVEREKLGVLNSRLRRALEDIGPLRGSLQDMMTETLPRRISRAQRSFQTTVELLRLDLTSPEAPVPVSEVIPVEAEEELGTEEEEELSSEERARIDDLINQAQSVLDEEKKAPTIKKLEQLLEGLPEDHVEGLQEVHDAIEAYQGIERAGQTPEEYQEGKKEAFEGIQEALDGMVLPEKEEEEEEPEQEPPGWMKRKPWIPRWSEPGEGGGASQAE